jgi:aryl-alcohol dehydrogenase-like predicted oxidoreductase
VQTITLGQNGPAVTPLCVGTWAWGDKLFWSYGKDYGSEQLRAAFHASVDAGVNFFDTAEVYGNGVSEELLGQFIKETDKPVQIATKFGPFPWRFTGGSVSDALTASLRRLQLDSVELYQVHWPFTFFLSQQTLMQALAEEYRRGRIKAIGVSNYSAEEMRQAHQYLADYGVPLAVNQVRYSLLSRKVETKGIISTAKELGVTILAYSPLAQGLLTGKYVPENNNQPSGARKTDSRFSKSGLEKISPLISLMREIGNKYDRTPAQVALNWLIAQGNVIPIPGAKTADQAKQNAGALNWQMTEEEVAKLEQASRPWLE